MSESLILAEIGEAFYPNGITGEQVVVGGIVNTTLLVTDAEKSKTILQKLSPIFDETMAEDFDVVSNHLHADGWEVAQAVKSNDAQSYVKDANGSLWRSFTYIESGGPTPPANLATSIALGGLLGSLHKSLETLNYTPKFSLPHFHDTAFYMNRLDELLPQLPTEELRNLGRNAIDLSRTQTIPDEPAQIIHGDPKMANALYRDGKPFTFIDFDTLMKANPLVDVGDMLRSVTGKLAVRNPEFTADQLYPIIDAYYDNAEPSVSREEFRDQALNAGQVLALELGSRFLIDVVEDTYFDWDKDVYDSRSAHNAARAQAQWSTYQALGLH